MDLLHPRCAGLDVHKDTVVACTRVQIGAEVTYVTKTFKTSTRSLGELSDWLTQHGCTHIAMEATGVYWKPVWHILEGHFELILANAQHIKGVPGRKTDVLDSQWIADLLAHGLIRASFVPPAQIHQLRGLTRTRKQFVHEQIRHTQRIQKTLEDANIKLTGALSDLLGMSGRRILDALVAGETDPLKLVALVNYRVRTPREELVEALRGHVTDQHRFLLKIHLGQIDSIDSALAEIDARIETHLDPIRAKVNLLTTIPGVSDLVARVIVAEIGVDMSRFPTAANLVSWAGFCPKMNESAGKRRSTRLRKGAPWLKEILVQTAWCAVRVKTSYYRTQFHRIRARRGAKKAIVAVAASILTAIFHMLQTGTEHADLGPLHFDHLNEDVVKNRLVRRLSQLGYDVKIEKKAA